MITALALLLLCQLAGEVIARGFHLSIPGPVLGAGLLLVILVLRERAQSILPKEINDGSLDKVANTLLANLSLLFIPAGVGVVQNLSIFKTHGVALVLALVTSSILALIVTAVVFRAVALLTGQTVTPAEEEEGDG